MRGHFQVRALMLNQYFFFIWPKYILGGGWPFSEGLSGFFATVDTYSLKQREPN